MFINKSRESSGSVLIEKKDSTRNPIEKTKFKEFALIAGDSKVETIKQSYYQNSEDLRGDSKSGLLVRPTKLQSKDFGIKIIEKRNANNTALASIEDPAASSLGQTV